MSDGGIFFFVFLAIIATVLTVAAYLERKNNHPICDLCKGPIAAGQVWDVGGILLHADAAVCFHNTRRKS